MKRARDDMYPASQFKRPFASSRADSYVSCPISFFFMCQFCIYDFGIASLPYFVLREWNMGLLLSVCVCVFSHVGLNCC